MIKISKSVLYDSRMIHSHRSTLVESLQNQLCAFLHTYPKHRSLLLRPLKGTGEVPTLDHTGETSIDRRNRGRLRLR